jgi:hypothetical protein
MSKKPPKVPKNDRKLLELEPDKCSCARLDSGLTNG